MMHGQQNVKFSLIHIYPLSLLVLQTQSVTHRWKWELYIQIISTNIQIVYTDHQHQHTNCIYRPSAPTYKLYIQIISTNIQIVYTDHQHQHTNSRGEQQNSKLRDPNRAGFSFSRLIMYCPKTSFGCNTVQLYSHPISGDTSAIHMQTGMSPVIVSRDSIMRRDQ
jgi:cell division protein FtsL